MDQPPAEQPEAALKKPEDKKPEDRKPKGLVLFRRWPRLRVKSSDTLQQIISLKAQKEFPTFTADFETLDKIMMPSYRELSDEARKGQNQFYLEQVILILGGMLVTTLGAVQVTLSAITHNSMWPGLAEAVLAALLAAWAQVTQATKAQERYFSSRLKAETLRGDYFLFLGRINLYEQEEGREDRLKMRVNQITRTINEAQQQALLSKWREIRQQRASGAIPALPPPKFWELYYEHRYEDQIGFYTDRTEEFRTAQMQATILTIILMATASVVSLFGSADLLNFSTGWAVLAILFPVLATGLATYQNVYAFERQAKLYEDAAAVLNTVQMPPTQAGNPKAFVQDYVDQIEFVFKMEQGQWGQLIGQINAAIPPGGTR